MDFLLADLARLPWAAPHHIQAVNEEYDEEYEALLNLDVPLMQQIPPIDGQEFALPIRDQGLYASQSFSVNKCVLYNVSFPKLVVNHVCEPSRLVRVAQE